MIQVVVSWLVVWVAWTIVGIFHDPIVNPRGKKSEPQTPVRFLVTFAYVQMVTIWVGFFKLMRLNREHKSIGEQIVGFGVMQARKQANRMVLCLRGGR